MILQDTETFQVLFIVSLFCASNITTVEMNSGVHLLQSQIRQVPLFTSGGLGLAILVLVLRIWSYLHQWKLLSAVAATILIIGCVHFEVGLYLSYRSRIQAES